VPFLYKRIRAAPVLGKHGLRCCSSAAAAAGGESESPRKRKGGENS